MKLVFKKDDDAQIIVLHRSGSEERDFTYVDMIKHLLTSYKLEEPEVSDGFTEAEKRSIDSMVHHINEKLASSATESTG